MHVSLEEILYLDAISEKFLFKIDLLFKINGVLYVSGWSSHDFSVETINNNSDGECVLKKHIRPDVDVFLKSKGVKPKEKSGFSIIATNFIAEYINIDILFVENNKVFSIQCKINKMITPLIQDSVILDKLFDKCDAIKIRGEIERLKRYIDDSKNIYIDYCHIYKLLTEETYIFFWQGWFLNRYNARLYYNSGSNDLIEINDVMYYYRQDIVDIFGDILGSGQQEGHGILACFKSNSIENKYFMEINDCLVDLPCSVPEKIETSYYNMLESLLQHRSFHIQKYNQLELVLKYIQIIHDDYTRMKRSIPITVSNNNISVKSKYSIIIPIYGNTRFLENQFIAFDDSQIKEEAEIIYVLDDPRILPEFKLKINHLQRIYNIDCRYVFGQINRGFASSNNLGAKIACGQYLIFMNSDVFPLEKGWLGKIINQMEVDDRCGAVGVKLLYADGTIQHVGMNFLFNYEVNIWTNIHPNAGLSPELLEDKKSHKVPAVTGACVAVRREDFEKINGWCEDYIIGDFEDSDFCFRIISLGKYIYVNTDIEMVHLERQSFILMGGEESFRQNLTILNGIIHQHKWHDLLIESSHQEGKQ